MNIQAILDATAQIAGGAQLRPGVYKGAGGIAGVKIAYSLPAEQAELVEDGPAHVSFWDGMEINPSGIAAGDLTVYRHTIRMQLVLAIGRSNISKAYSLLTPFVPLYITAFAGKLRLNGTCAVSGLERVSGVIDAIYPNRLAIEFTLIAIEKEAVTYAP